MRDPSLDRNVVIASILIAVILFGWMWLAAPPPEDAEDPETPADTAEVVEEEPEAEDPEAEPLVETEEPEPVEDDAVAGALEGEEELITVESDLYTAQFSTKGGTIRSFELKEFLTFDQTRQVNIADTLRPGSLGVLFTTPDAHELDTRDLFFEPDFEESSLSVEDEPVELAFTADLGEGSLRLIYTFYPGEYEVDLRVEQENPLSYSTRGGYELVWDGGVPFAESNPDDEAHYAGAYARSGGELESIDLRSNDSGEQSLRGNVEWVSVKNKYFAAVLMPQQETAGAELIGQQVAANGEQVMREDFLASLLMPVAEEGSSDAFTMYLGPLEYYRINDYDAGLYEMVDFGWSFFTWITRPMARFIFIPAFWYLGDWLPNMGLVVIVLALLIKTVLYPLTKSSYRSMAQMRELQPQMKAIQEEYGDDPQKQQQAMMKLYKKSGVNPLGACLPMLMQWPVLIALYMFLQQSIEIRQEGFLWASDLSAPDPILSLPFEIPFYGDFVAGFTLLMAISLVIQMRIQGTASASGGGAQGKIMMYLMPGFLFVFFNRFPSGLSLYYLIYNIISAVQQKLINMGLEKEKEEGDLDDLWIDDENLSRRERNKLKRKRKKAERKRREQEEAKT